MERVHERWNVPPHMQRFRFEERAVFKEKGTSLVPVLETVRDSSERERVVHLLWMTDDDYINIRNDDMMSRFDFDDGECPDGYLKVSDWVYLDSYFAIRRRAFERVNGPLELEGSDEEVDADD